MSSLLKRLREPTYAKLQKRVKREKKRLAKMTERGVRARHIKRQKARLGKAQLVAKKVVERQADE